VRVKTVDEVTLTLALVPLTAPTPLSIERLVAPVTDHESVAFPPPLGSEPGEAEKREITGAPVVTVTDAWPLTPEDGSVAMRGKVPGVAGAV
jgi:hypothetical protein